MEAEKTMNVALRLGLVPLCWSILLSNAQGEIKIDRVWAEYDYGYALVSYTNDSNKTFWQAVTIQCTAKGQGGKKLNTNTRSFFVHNHGPIAPGFTGTLKIPVRLHGAELQSMSCRVRER